jgi:hypothetical protein
MALLVSVIASGGVILQLWKFGRGVVIQVALEVWPEESSTAVICKTVHHTYSFQTLKKS